MNSKAMRFNAILTVFVLVFGILITENSAQGPIKIGIPTPTPTPTPIYVSKQGLKAASSEKGNIYVYYLGTDNQIWKITRNKGVWGTAQNIVGKNINVGIPVGSPDACSPNPGKTIVMFRGKNNTLFSAVKDESNKKSGIVNYYSRVGADPSIACQSGDRVNLFVRGNNNQELYTAYSENGSWSHLYDLGGIDLAIEDVVSKATAKKSSSFWSDLFGGEEFKAASNKFNLGASGLGGQMKGSPEGVSFGGQDRAVFVRGLDDQVWWRVTYNGNPWEQFENLGGMKITSDPTAISRKNGEITLFARGENNKLYARSYKKGGKWSPWLPWGGTMAGNPDAASWGGNRLDVFYRGADGFLYHAWLDDAAIGKTPQIEKVPVSIKNDPTALGATW